MLCESAEADAEQLLSITRGGMDRCHAPAYPADLALTLAVLLELDDRDQGRPLSISVVVLNGQVDLIGGAEGGSVNVTGDLQPGDTAKVPLVIPLSGVVLPEPGDYEVRFVVDGDTLAVLPLRAMAI